MGHLIVGMFSSFFFFMTPVTEASRGLVASLEAVAGRLGLPAALPTGVEASCSAQKWASPANFCVEDEELYLSFLLRLWFTQNGTLGILGVY